MRTTLEYAHNGLARRGQVRRVTLLSGAAARGRCASMLLSSLLLFGLAAYAPAQSVLIKNATVLTVAKGTIENGSVLIQDGKIAAVGKNISAPAGAAIVDGTGKFLMPGIIDCHSHTAVEGSVNEGSVSDSSMVNIADVIDPYDINIYRRLGRWPHGLQRLTRQRERHWRANGRDQTPLGKDGEGTDL